MANQSNSCHVFLSFRGETRNIFTCHLYDALVAEGFETFYDKRTITAGDEVDSTIKDGIKGSKSAIIVFSQKYAWSTWCLDELLLILERNKTSTYLVIPILYKVKSADIKHQLDEYGAALQKHKARHGHKVEQWRGALAEAGNLLGQHVEGEENVFIKNIVKLFREKFLAKFPEFRHQIIPQTPLSPQRISGSTQENATTSQVNDHSSSRSRNVVFYSKDHDWRVDHIRWHLRNVKFVERNCLKKPEYIPELEKMMRGKSLRFPMLFMDGTDVSEFEDRYQLEGLLGIQDPKEVKDLMSALNYYMLSNPTAENVAEYARLTGY